MTNKSLGTAILQGCCPRCREGKLFPTNIWSYTKLSEVNQKCAVCSAVIIPEPDFFYGAMYISYAFSVALVVNVMIILSYFFDDLDVWVYVSTVLVLNVILIPFFLRYSKVLYLYGVGKLTFDPDWKQNK